MSGFRGANSTLRRPPVLLSITKQPPAYDGRLERLGNQQARILGHFRKSANLWGFSCASDGTLGVVNQFHLRHMSVCNNRRRAGRLFSRYYSWHRVRLLRPVPNSLLLSGVFAVFLHFLKSHFPVSLPFLALRFSFVSWLSRLSEGVSNRILEV